MSLRFRQILSLEIEDYVLLEKPNRHLILNHLFQRLELAPRHYSPKLNSELFTNRSNCYESRQTHVGQQQRNGTSSKHRKVNSPFRFPTSPFDALDLIFRRVP